MKQRSKNNKPKPNQGKSVELQNVTLKKCLEIRDAELKELRIKYEASLKREKELENGFAKVQSIIEQLGLSKGNNIVRGYIPIFPLGLKFEAKIGSKICPTVLFTTASSISTISIAEAKRLGLPLIQTSHPIQINFWYNTFTISTQLAMFAPIMNGGRQYD